MITFKYLNHQSIYNDSMMDYNIYVWLISDLITFTSASAITGHYLFMDVIKKNLFASKSFFNIPNSVETVYSLNYLLVVI